MRALLVACALIACAPGAERGDDERTAAQAGRIEAPSWLLSNDAHGTWSDNGVLHAWADARVANVRFHKRVLAEVVSGGITTVHAARYKGSAGAGERWGTETIEIFDPRLPVFIRFRLQHDLDNDGRDEMVETPWTTLHGSGAPPARDPWAPGLTSPARAGTAHPPELRFAPFDDPGAMVVREIDTVIAAKAADPAGRHTMHAAIFNINDPRIVDRVIAAHRAGVEVRLITDAKKFRPSATYLTGDDALIAAGVPMLGIGHEGHAAMHLKVALFDGKKVATGSANWEWGSSFENHELMALFDDPAVVTAYAQRFEWLAGGVLSARVGSRDVAFGPDEEPHRRLGELIDRATTSVHVAMFTAKDFSWDSGQSLFKKLVAAKKRGVDVVLVTDEGVAEGSEFHGVTTADDPTDEWLEREGIRVVRADVPFAKYASMHHKFMVVDGETAALGAYNWYFDSAFLNDEDVVFVRDRAIAARFEGELAELCRRYDSSFDPARWPSVQVTLAAEHPHTAWGESVVALGEDAFGNWATAIPLSGYPIWRGTITAPAGARLSWKLATRRRDGSLSWEAGDNRLLTVATGTSAQLVSVKYR
jgi:hypothetical protein